MNTLSRYLWKEWRDHRAIVLGLLLAWPLILALAAAALPGKTFTHAWFATLSGAAMLSIFVFAACTDLFPGESRRGTMRLLSRLPAGLRAPLFAKFAFFALGCALTLGVGWFGGAVLVRWLGGAWPVFEGVVLIPWLAAILVWALAVSCGLSRGVLTFPTTAVLGALVLAPIVAVFYYFRHLELERHAIDAHPLPFVAVGCLALYFGFVRGRRFGRGALSSFCWVGGMAVVAAAPVYGSMARDVVALYAAEKSGERVILNAWIGEDAQMAFLSVARKTPFDFRNGAPHFVDNHVVVVNLGTGAERRVPGGSWVSAPGGHRPTFQAILAVNGPGHAQTWLVGRTGAAISQADAIETLLPAARQRNGWMLADGTRVWRDRAKFYYSDGRVVDVGVWTGGSTQRGTGIAHPKGTFDLVRGKIYTRKAIEFAGDTWARPTRWLARKARRDKHGVMHYTWLLLDPDTGAREPAHGIRADEGVVTVLEDGRALLQSRAEHPRITRGPITIWNPDTGARIPLRCSVNMDGCRFQDANSYGMRWGPKHAPDGARIFQIMNEDHLMFATLRPGADELTTYGAWAIAARNYYDHPQLLGVTKRQEAYYLVERNEIWVEDLTTKKRQRAWTTKN